MAFSNLGVAIHQLFLLQSGSNALQNEYGKALSIIFICAGILICLKGAWRFYRQQAAMVRNKIIARGWELVAVTVVSAVAVMTLFGVIVGVSA